MTCNGLGNFERTCRKNLPVCEFVVSATSSGVPTATISPPSSPASGPRSTIQSALLITSRLCSITTSECPRSTRRWNNCSSIATSSKCSPVVGSSKMKRLPTPTFIACSRFIGIAFPLDCWALDVGRSALLVSAKCLTSFNLCDSPPESVFNGCPSRR